MMMRLLESFFRRWWLYLVPVVLLAGLGFMSVSGSKSLFRAGGTINVQSQTLLGELSDIQNDQSFGFDTPAIATSKKINAQLQTDQFIGKVVTAAQLDDAVKSGQITYDQIRSSVGASDNGETFVNVVATSVSPVVAQRLAAATIDSFIQGIVDAEVGQSQAAEDFFSGLLVSYQADVDAARGKLDDYLKAHPAPLIGERPDEEGAQITRLNADVTTAEGRYNTAVSKSEDARLSTEQTKSDITQRLAVVDEPTLPEVAEPKLKKAVFTMATFLLLGLILSAGAVVLGTIMDHSLRFPADVKERLGVRVIGVVPEAKTKTKTKTKQKAAKKPAAPKKQDQPPKTPRRLPAAPVKRPAAAARPAARGRAAGPATRPTTTRRAG
jgi:uncharacterized protein involved in exopolysaccharide biosynthesis